MQRSRLMDCGRTLMAVAVVFGSTATLAQGQAEDQDRFPAGEWISLFDGKTLEGWKATQFGGEGGVTIDEGVLTLGFGSPLTGVTYTPEDLPKTNYEIELEARKTQGIDFFCALTFPVDNSHCSFVVGGWAGSVVGLSSIDGKDASRNDTTKYMSFKKDTWYKVRVRVTSDHIEAWLDGEQVVKQPLEGKEISIRPEVDLNRPLGICSFETIAGLRNIRLRRLPAKP